MCMRLNAAHAEEILMIKYAEPKMHRLSGHLISLFISMVMKSR